MTKIVTIDQAPLVGSPTPTGTLVDVEILRESTTGQMLYVLPKHGPPVYIFKHWLRENASKK